MVTGNVSGGSDSIEAIAEAERTAWFVRSLLADVAWKHAGKNPQAAIALLERAIDQVAQLEEVAN